MNELERLSSENKENYKRYLKRMTESMKYSTKGLIPLLAKNGKNILDVGCGSGVMLNALESENEGSYLTGIDLNIDAINNLKQYNKKWNLYHIDFMELNNIKFDTIIFSSILHEISSYHKDLSKRFTEKPILAAFKKCNNLLEDNGTIILRDGLLSPINERNNMLTVSFTDVSDDMWLYKFKNDFKGFDNLDINTKIIKLKENKYMVSEGFLKEFLYTYTWGEESYPREINERFGILTKDEWISLLKEAGFKIETIIESREEYEKYLSPRVNITYENGMTYEYPNMTIIFKAQKLKSLK